MWELRLLKILERQEKCRNFASSPYWRSVEDLNCILLEACGSTCN